MRRHRYHLGFAKLTKTVLVILSIHMEIGIEQVNTFVIDKCLGL